MKIHLHQNEKRLGPYSLEEVQEEIYSGELERSTPACVDGQSAWHPVETLLVQQRAWETVPTVPPVITVTIDQLRDPHERTALIWLYIAAVPGFLLALLVFLPFLILALLAVPVL